MLTVQDLVITEWLHLREFLFIVFEVDRYVRFQHSHS